LERVQFGIIGLLLLTGVSDCRHNTYTTEGSPFSTPV
jgi:hypothetical protein